MKWERAIGIAGSLIIHLLIIAFLFLKITDQPQQTDDREDSVKVTKLYVEIMPPTFPADGTGKGGAPLADEKCQVNESYLGIGITHSFGDVVNEVAPDGPAEKVGIVIGDRLLNRRDLGPNRFKKGERVRVVIERNGKIITVYPIVDKICYE